MNKSNKMIFRLIKAIFIISLSIWTISGVNVLAQEKSGRFILPVEIGQGFRSLGSLDNEDYLADFRIEPMYSFFKNPLRLGVVGSSVYSNKRVCWLVGPRASLRLIKIKWKSVGRVASVVISPELLWGTGGRKLWNLAFALETWPFLITLRGYHEYANKEFWFESTLGVRIEEFFKKEE